MSGRTGCTLSSSTLNGHRPMARTIRAPLGNSSTICKRSAVPKRSLQPSLTGIAAIAAKGQPLAQQRFTAAIACCFSAQKFSTSSGSTGLETIVGNQTSASLRSSSTFDGNDSASAGIAANCWGRVPLQT
eukprot:CAMPEP_0115383802 /NCGR_PEP_ID=MMETSP0271-20121206/6781_1 /TAXON_ID=71861 /ORGANISM="Scrippsiella trochoidea, Strain CCMP3099" /LENGTH=129 /DNA_ID=CAMNT_0002807139 /DNA_START=802 /DNA_END=1191 /DNA_ORIENTATION=-